MAYQGQALPNLALAMLRQVEPEMENPTASKTGGAAASIAFANRDIPLTRNGEVLNLLYPQQALYQSLLCRSADRESGPPRC